MASEVQDWATTAAGNNTGSAPSYPVEGQSPSSVNDTMREMMSAIARWLNDTNGTLTSTGAANAYALTTNRSLSAYADGDTFLWESNHTNSGAATLNCDTVGAIDIEKDSGDALLAGDIISGGRYIVVYDSTATAFHILNPTISGIEGSLRHTDGTDRVAPTSGGADVTGPNTEHAVFDVIGTGVYDPVLGLRSDTYGARVYLDETDGAFYLRQTDPLGTTGEDVWLAGRQDGAVDLYYDNGKTFSTTADGVDGLGTIFDWINSGATATFSRLRNSEGGMALRVDADAARIDQTDAAGTSEIIWISMANAAGVTLNFNNAARVATSAAGATVTGTLNATTSLTAGGVAALLAGGELNDLANADKTLGADGHYTFPGGFTVQWGTLSVGANNTGTADNLSATFTTAYGGVCTPINKTTVDALDTNHSVVSVSTTQITISSGYDATTSYFWIALGHIA